ncbi:polysaccharide deacetylase family protein [Smaragdicoccus niigatensis]|uniref:polysaccharide deacetylase family protein n=1 Tax=Smaragdicoccus niigatensis TaxID=359359 RepID=UPI000377FD71|nr:polysaccharide deacetylase family protein [Smaragdicoccus niigatensis]
MTPPNVSPTGTGQGKHAAVRQSRRVASPLITAVIVLLVLAYLLGPAVWQWSTGQTKMAAMSNEQVTTIDANDIDSALVDKLVAAPTSTQSGPLILTYHDIGYEKGQYQTTPEAFATQMKLLADAGWTTISAGQLLDWLDGKPLPAHSVMITFDDGTRGVWKYADPILASHNMRAISFVITGFVGTHEPYYMTWEQIEELHSSGRWDIESHTHLGHLEVPVDSKGTTAPFLTSLMWLDSKNRKETVEEWRDRVTTDLKESKDEIARHGLGEPTLFAYPFSANRTDPDGTSLLPGVLAPMFRASLLDAGGVARTTTLANLASGDVARMDITSDVTPAVLTDRLLEASGIDPRGLHPLVGPNRVKWATAQDTDTAIAVPGADGTIEFKSRANYQRYVFAPVATAMWCTYTVTADIGGFQPDSTSSAGLIALLEDAKNQIDVSVSGDEFQVHRGLDNDLVAAGALAFGSSHRVQISVSTTAVSVTVDGVRVYSATIDAPTGGHRVAGSVAVYQAASSARPTTIRNMTIS